jgi:tRNA A37 threonylcarbamoyltransferase TsaD
MKIKTLTVDLPLRPKDATQYTPYERIAITADIEEGENIDKVYQDLQLEVQRLYYTKHLPEDAYLQVAFEEVEEKKVNSISDLNTQGREQPRKEFAVPDDDLPF